jgi:hypothetical protein
VKEYQADGLDRGCGHGLGNSAGRVRTAFVRQHAGAGQALMERGKSQACADTCDP